MFSVSRKTRIQMLEGGLICSIFTTLLSIEPVSTHPQKVVFSDQPGPWAAVQTPLELSELPILIQEPDLSVNRLLAPGG